MKIRPEVVWELINNNHFGNFDVAEVTKWILKERCLIVDGDKESAPDQQYQPVADFIWEIRDGKI